MFTGIIESPGSIISIASKGTNKIFWVASALSPELKPDQSVAHNGVCLTVEEISDKTHRVTAVQETLQKTNMKKIKKEIK
jgi:riboflavin synthase